MRSSRLLVPIAFACTSLWACITCAAEPYEITAEFVAGDGSKLLPTADYAWTDLTRVEETGDVLVLGDFLLLRIADGKPFVTLGMAHELDRLPLSAPSIAAPDSHTRIRSYTRRNLKVALQDPGSVTNVLVASRDDGRWEALSLPEVDLPDDSWRIARLVPSSAGRFYAILVNTGLFVPDLRSARFDDLPWLTRLLEYRDGSWEDAGKGAIGPLHRILDACKTASGRLLVVGRVLALSADGTIASVRGFAAARDADRGMWTTVEVEKPTDAGRIWSLTKVACGYGSRHWLGAEYTSPERGPPTAPLLTQHVGLYRLDELDGGVRTQRLATVPAPGDLPPRPAEGHHRYTPYTPYTQIAALAVDGDDAPWLSLTDPSRSLLPLWRYDGTSWIAYPLPRIDGIDFYSVRGLVFPRSPGRQADSSAAGWGISTISGGAVAPYHRGVLLRFDGDAWRLQGWKWSRLRQRGFGLFGNLR